MNERLSTTKTVLTGRVPKNKAKATIGPRCKKKKVNLSYLGFASYSVGSWIVYLIMYCKFHARRMRAQKEFTVS